MLSKLFSSLQCSRQSSQLLLGAVLIALGSAITPGLAYAQAGFDEQFYSSNDILFYDPTVTCTGGGNFAGLPTLVGNSNAEKIWNFLTSKGLSPEQAAGVMGNLQQESGFRPDAVEGGNGIGFGIAQWSFGRRTQLETAAAKKGILASDLSFQLEFLYQEATTRTAIRGGGTEWEVLKRQATVNDALVFWHDSFERSADSAQKVISVRGKYAQDAFASFNKGGASTPGTSSSSSSSSGCPSAAVTGDLAQLTVAYAWPQYHAAPYVNKQPAYETAIQKAKSEGKYIGGITYPGVDCGGFITTLMINSGFEPNYNYGGVISSGAGSTTNQEAWLKANWQTLGKGSSINTGDLKPGDVAMQPGHTFVYVGTVPGLDSKVASSSLDQRAPMAGKESLVDSSVTWYRKK